MGGQGIIRQAVTFRNQLEIGLAGLKKHLDLPAFPIDPDDLFFGKVRFRADISHPVLLIFSVSYTDDLCRDFLVFSNHDVYRKQIFTASAALFADAEDLADGKLFPLVLIVNAGTLLNHGNGIQPQVFDRDKLGGIGEPCIKQNIVCALFCFLRRC